MQTNNPVVGSVLAKASNLNAAQAGAFNIVEGAPKY